MSTQRNANLTFKQIRFGFLASLLILSGLSAISVTPANAADLTAANCPTVQVTTISTVTYSKYSDYCVLEFQSGSNNFTVPAGVQTATLIVVGGGGGGGGRDWSGGGGAGGVLYGNSYPLTANASIALSVGTGGTGATSGATNSAGTSAWVYSSNRAGPITR